VSDESLEQQFHEAMLGIFEQARMLRPPYIAHGFRQMVNQHGGKEAADRLLAKSTPSEGFTELFLRGPENLRISVEYLVLQSPWRNLFDQEQLGVARRRLIDVGSALPPEDTMQPVTSIEPNPSGSSATTEVVASTQKIVPPAVRILPMSSEIEFPGQSAKDVQAKFFLGELPLRSPAGEYLYRSKGIQTPFGTVVLFQFQNQIIANATLERVVRFDKPKDAYHGALYFDANSIRVFDPVGADKLKQVWPTFSGLGNAPLALDPERYPEFERLLKGVRSPGQIVSLPEEVVSTGPLTEGAVTQIRINAYERNPEARRRCIEYHKPICAICRFDFGVVYGPAAEGFIHVHHLVPLSEIGTVYEVDPIRDLLPVCPNCHSVIHLGGGCRSIDEVKAMLASTGQE
jgi:hypothetical protein